MEVQTSSVTMLALGSDGTDASFYGGLQTAHLRWMVGADKDWPLYGFELYRRTARVDTTTTLTLSTLALSAAITRGTPKYLSMTKLQSSINLSLASLQPPQTTSTSFYDQQGSLQIGGSVALSYKAHWPTAADTAALNTTGGGMCCVVAKKPLYYMKIRFMQKAAQCKVVAFDDDVPVYETLNTIKNSQQSIIIRADRFNKVSISFTGITGFYEISYVEVPSTVQFNSVNGEWVSLGTFGLPTSEADVVTRVSTPMDVKGSGYYSTKWPNISQLSATVSAGEQIQKAIATSGSTPVADAPELRFNSKSIIGMLAAADVGMARSFGVYYIHQDNSSAPVNKRVEVGKSYDYAIVARWTNIATNDAAWLCYNVTIAKPLALHAPTGVQVSLRTVPGGLFAAALAGQSAVELLWDVPVSAVGVTLPKSPVIYRVQREKKLSTGWSTPKLLNDQRPLFASHNSDSGDYPTALYTDTSVSNGTYAYAVAGVDLFGRVSPYSAKATIDAKDLLAPPPPVGLKATIDATTKNATVDWAWTTDQQVQASDLSSFRIFYQVDNLQPLESYVSAVTTGASTLTLVTDLDPSGSYSDYSDGYVIQRGRRYSVATIKIVTGKVHIDVVAVYDTDGSPIVPTVYDPAKDTGSLPTIEEPFKLSSKILLCMNWSNTAHWKSAYKTVASSASSGTDDNGAAVYQATITGMPLHPSAAAPITKALFGVCSVDASGNVGKMSFPVLAHCVLTDVPPTPGGLLPDDAGTDDGIVWAKRADYYGNSAVDFTFDAGTDDFENYYYELLRASDTTLQLAVTGSAADAASLTDEVVLQMADELDEDSELVNRKAFVNVGAKNADGTALTATARTVSYTDTVPGSGNARYVYKVQAYDRAGNRSLLSAANQIIKLIDVTPPAKPVITSILGGDRLVTITWAANKEPDLAGYKVYRCTDESLANDIRTMELVADYTDLAQQTHSDSALQGMTMYFYRIVAYDTSSNLSQPSVTGVRTGDQTQPNGVSDLLVSRTDDSTLAFEWSSSTPYTSYIEQEYPAHSESYRLVHDATLDYRIHGEEFLYSASYAIEVGAKYNYRVSYYGSNGRKNTASFGGIE